MAPVFAWASAPGKQGVEGTHRPGHVGGHGGGHPSGYNRLEMAATISAPRATSGAALAGTRAGINNAGTGVVGVMPNKKIKLGHGLAQAKAAHDRIASMGCGN